MPSRGEEGWWDSLSRDARTVPSSKWLKLLAVACKLEFPTLLLWNTFRW